MTEASTAPGQLRLEVETDLASVERLLDEWRALAATSARSPTEAPDWLFPLAQRYLDEYQTRFLTWRNVEGELVGVAPFSLISDRPRLRPIRQLALWGATGPRLRGLVDVVARQDDRASVLDSLTTWLRQPGWDVVRINRPQHGSATPGRLRSEAASRGWTYASAFNLRSTTYQIDLPSTPEEWQHHLKGNDRRSVASRRRRFESFRQGSVTPAVESSELGAVLDEFEPILRERWGEREIYFRNEPRWSRLLHEAIPRLVDRGDAWVSVLRDQSGFVAGIISLAQNGYAMSLLMAATPAAEYRPFSLGDQIHEVAIGEAVRRGCHTYDLLWAGGYKESFWRAQPRVLETAYIGRGILGSLAARAFARRENQVPTGPS